MSRDSFVEDSFAQSTSGSLSIHSFTNSTYS